MARSHHSGSSDASHGDVPNAQRLRALGGAIDERAGTPSRRARRRQRHASRRHSRARPWWIALGVVGLVIVLVVAAGAGYLYYLNSKIHRVEVGNLTTGLTTGADAGTQNILMIGSTSRCALKVQNAAYGLCSAGVNGVNSDVIMILHLNPATRAVSILSIPRDLFLPNARSGPYPYGGYKIDAALYQGQSQLIKVIREDFGIGIQHSVELNFDTFANVVNALGGINMYFPMPVFDAYSGLNIPRAGCVHLDGYHALQVVRARHLQYRPASVTTTNHAYWPYELQSDLGRINRDHEFLRVLASSVAKQGLGNPVTDFRLVNSVAGQLEFDNAFTTSDMVHLLLTFHSAKINSAPQLTIPVSVGPNTSYIYAGYPKGEIEFPSLVPDLHAIDQFLQISPDTNTLTGQPLPRPSAVTVSVVNGSGVANIAATTLSSLEALGFRGAGTGNTPVLASQLETLVEYASPSTLGAAEAVAHAMTGAVTLMQAPTTNGAQVTVVTGTQFAVNRPAVARTAPAAGTTTPSSGSSSGTTTPTVVSSATSAAEAASAGFQPPSVASPTLTPWDPRACPPGMPVRTIP